MSQSDIDTAAMSVEEISENPKAAVFPVGMKIDDRYEIIGVLGTGGFATVYRAKHLLIEREVALKVMDTHKGIDSSYQDRFFREAKIAAKIQHPNVVTIYDYGLVEETQQPYIAMELLEGHDLGDEIANKGPLSPNRAYTLFRPALEALGEGHAKGIIHKDLKPANLYLTDPGGVRESMRILDFGVARVGGSEVAKVTVAGQLMGTPRYLAPEYIKKQIVTPAIDVYQMALIFSEALTGVAAAEGNPYTAMMYHCTGNIKICDFLKEGEVGKVFAKALSIDHEERYANAQAFADALDSVSQYFESDVPIKGGIPQRSPIMVSTSDSESRSTPPPGFRPPSENELPLQPLPLPVEAQRSSGTKIIVAVLAAVILTTLAALAFLFNDEESPPTNVVAIPAADPAPAPIIPDTVLLPPIDMPQPQEIETLVFLIDSEPAGADVINTFSKQKIGVTPYELNLSSNDEIDIKLEKDNYKSSETFTLNGKIPASKREMKITLEKKSSEGSHGRRTRTSKQAGTGSDTVKPTEQPQKPVVVDVL